METMKLRKRWVSLTLGGLVALLTAAMLPATAGATTLGGALAFSALSTSTTDGVTLGKFAQVGTTPLGSVGGDFVSLGGSNSSTGGDVIGVATVEVGNYSQVKGECVSNGGPGSITFGLPVSPPSKFQHCVLGASDSGSPKLTDLANAISDVATFDTALLAFPPTDTLPAKTITSKFFPPLSPANTITDTVSGGLNVIEIPSVTIASSRTLYLQGTGAPGETLVLEITGDLSIANSSKIVLSGLSPVDVLIYVGGKVALWGSSTTVEGTVLAPGTDPINVGSQAKVDGAVIGGGDVTFLDNAKLLFDPTIVDIPSGPPSTPTLGEAEGFLILSTQGTTSLGHVTLGLPAAPNSGDIGGETVTLGNSSKIDGDVVASSAAFPAIALSNFAKVVGHCITQDSPADTLVDLGTGNSKGSCGFFTDPDDKIALLSSAAGDVNTYSAEVGSLPVDQVLPAINVVTANNPFTIKCTSVPKTTGVYVTDTPSVTVGSAPNTLIIDASGCPADTTMVINVTGSGSGGIVDLKPGFTVKEAAGTSVNRVLFNVEGALVPPGATIIGGQSSHFSGTLVAPIQNCEIGPNANINGQLICGGNVGPAAGSLGNKKKSE